MKFCWNTLHCKTQIIMTVVFFLISGTFSAGFADSKKNLIQPKKQIIQKVKPVAAPLVRAKKLPDLSVSNIKISPANPMDSDTIFIKAVVKNIGQVKSPPSIFKIQIGGKVYPLIRVPKLAKNQHWQYKTKVNIKRQGKYRITAVINPDKKIPENNYKNNTGIKNFRIKKIAPTPKKMTPTPKKMTPTPKKMTPKSKRMTPTTNKMTPKSKRMTPKKSKLKTVGSPPPSGPTPVDGPVPYPAPALQIKPIEVSLASKYHAEILEIDIRHEQEGYYWEVLYKNTGSEPLPNWGYFIRVEQISEDGSAETAGREWIMDVLYPGNTKKCVDNLAWQKKDDTKSLRVAIWRNHYTGNHKLITRKTIPFPKEKLTLKPLELAVQFSIDISELEVKKNANPEYLQWRARITNAGANSPSNNRLRARAIIISNDGTEEPVSGNDRILSGLHPGASFLTNEIIAMGSKQPGMDQLRLEIWDTEKNITIKSATIPFPSNAELNAEPVYRSLRIQSSEYLGNGQWNVEVKNTGNNNINPNELSVIAKYHINQSVMPQSQPFYNNSIIPPGQTATIEGFGLSNENGCESFWCIDLFVYDSVKDKTYTHVINTPNVLSATIEDIRLERSVLSYRLVNMTPYPVRVTVEIEVIEIWDGPKPQNNDSSWWEDVVDFLDGAEFDTSGLQPEVLKGTARNVVLSSYDLQAGGTPMLVMLNASTLNAMLRAKCSGVNFSDYSYLFKNLRLTLKTGVLNTNIGNLNGQDPCTTARSLDLKIISEGGSRDIPAFVW
ncbi:MAG: hypothetical protein KAJ62_11555 [Desulfobacteraceae bacterium]|nr:hypothetical protein [Desulfobacteraceae bacterium]